MIKKVNAAGNIVLPKALAGCVFDLQEQEDGSIRLIWIGSQRNQTAKREPMPRRIFRKLSLHLSPQIGRPNSPKP
jgi:hypothetical protein